MIGLMLLRIGNMKQDGGTLVGSIRLDLGVFLVGSSLALLVHYMQIIGGVFTFGRGEEICR